MPILKPVGHHSTRLNDDLALRAATAALQSRWTTSPRYRSATAMYLPLRGSQTTIWLLGSKPGQKSAQPPTQTAVAESKLTLEGQVGNLEALVRALGGRDDRRIADERVVDAGVGNQVGLELVQIDVEGAVEPQRGG